MSANKLSKHIIVHSVFMFIALFGYRTKSVGLDSSLLSSNYLKETPLKLNQFSLQDQLK